MSYQKQKDLAFTIVELLIVIVIIGILAAITIVSYRGITQRATEVTLQADLSNASKKIKLYFADHGVYPTTMDPDGNGNYCPTGPTDANYCIKPSGGSVFSYSLLSAGQDFSLISTKGLVSFRVTKDTQPGVFIETSFVKTSGSTGSDCMNSIIQTNDGKYIGVGYSLGFGAGDSDILISKFDSSGAVLWSKTWGGAGSDVGNDIIQSDDGLYGVVGTVTGFGTGSVDAILIKIDQNGNLVWNKVWGGATTDTGVGVTKTNDGGFVITGSTNSYGSGFDDMFLVKYSSIGVLVWNKTWGGSGYDGGQNIIQTNDGGFMVAGSGGSYGAGMIDAFLAKYDLNGNLSWSKTWGGASSDCAYGLIQTSDSGYAITGYTLTYGTAVDIFTVKFDSSGTLVWNKTWGGLNSEAGNSIIQTSDNGYIVAGYEGSYGAGNNDLILLKYDVNGNLVWNKTWGGAGIDNGQDIIRSIDGGYVVTGMTGSFGVGSNDSLFYKIKSDGTVNNCVSPMCQSPSATIITPSASVTSPSASTTSPSASVTTPSATVTSPSATVTTVVAP